MTPALSLRGITVRYGAALADDDVSLDVLPGEVHALIGENGAGKSTLLRAACGMVPLDGGEVWIAGERIGRPSPIEASRRGVGMVHQHFLLVSPLSVAENVTLGREPIRPACGPLGILDRGAAAEEVARSARAHGLTVDPGRLASELSVGEAQRVEILRALGGPRGGARVLLLDEPTAVLSPSEIGPLLALLGRLRDEGAAVVLVTHKLDEVAAIADRVTVLRRGRVTARYRRDEASNAALVRAMVGREPDAGLGVARRAVGASAPPRLQVEALSVAGAGARALRGVSFQIAPGEILGVAGVEGNGQTELVEALAGLRPASSGRVLLDGQQLLGRDVAARRTAGLVHVPEDRQRRGLLLDASIAENLLLGAAGRFRKGPRGWRIDRAALRREAEALCAEYAIRASADTPARALSGGNQQKLVVARELRGSPSLILAAQPTRGVDVGAIERIHRAILARREAGSAVLLVSSELDELLALSDRIAVLHRGVLVAILPRAEATTARLGAHMTGAAA